MDYRESLDYILNFADFERLPRSGIVWDLKRVESLLARLGNPHLSAKTVHVAGTKGKGSTAAMITSVLRQAGYRTGFYTSPHLRTYTERIQVDGVNISEDDWARLATSIQPFVTEENADGSHGELTTFEILTAMAFLHFRNVKADYQVMEVGLGGRLDATNVVSPDVCVITSISYDHMDVLGNTLTEIAGEKAGIIKPGVPVVTAPQETEALKVIEKVCREKKCPVVRVGADVIYRLDHFDLEGQSFHVKGRRGEYDLRIPLLGWHQVQNATNAVAAAEVLASQGADITPTHIKDGLFSVKWEGRLQVLRRDPWVVVDGAHNADSMQKLGHALKAHFSYD
ncbi:MAG: bifunctional folylpolyglutamate synthase/dihydrofolate synthase, partial [Dehalococcoidales bacterium]|nr:bifunctional folylpolyglutamate synthase/dihydrofolate synthase [Dehalococcoidales bacterium]